MRKIEELREIRKGVSRALLDIWRGARLVREGVDVTDAHKLHLLAVVGEIDDRIAAYEVSPVSSRAP